MKRLVNYTPERYGGDFIAIPIADYDKTITELADSVNMSQENRSIIWPFFLCEDDGEEYIPTFSEYNELRNTNHSGIWVDIETEQQEYQLVELWRLADHTAERAVVHKFGTGKPVPSYTVFPSMRAIELELKPKL